MEIAMEIPMLISMLMVSSMSGQQLQNQTWRADMLRRVHEYM